MYATAQRVRGPDGEGINAFVHDGAIPLDLDWRAFDASQVNVGSLLKQQAEVRPGGNSVLSFLDLVCPDRISAADVPRALPACPDRVERRTWTWASGSLLARFSLSGGQAFGPDPATEFAELAAAIANALERLHEANPLVIRKTILPDGIEFDLPPETLERLRKRHGPDWNSVRLHAKTEVLQQWEAVAPAEVDEELLRILTGLRPEQAEAEGGVRTLVRRPDR